MSADEVSLLLVPKKNTSGLEPRASATIALPAAGRPANRRSVHPARAW